MKQWLKTFGFVVLVVIVMIVLDKLITLEKALIASAACYAGIAYGNERQRSK